MGGSGGIRRGRDVGSRLYIFNVFLFVKSAPPIASVRFRGILSAEDPGLIIFSADDLVGRMWGEIVFGASLQLGRVCMWGEFAFGASLHVGRDCMWGEFVMGRLGMWGRFGFWGELVWGEFACGAI